MSRPQIPRTWRTVLTEIQRLDPHAIIAGGALRDLNLKREPKDLDIFVCESTKLIDIAEMLDGGVADEIESFSDVLCKVSATITGENLGLEIPLNIVVCSDELLHPIDRLPHFDFGICQIAHDGHEWSQTDAYWEDYTQSKFTLMRCTNYQMYQNSMKRYQRISERYPVWPLVIPWQFRHYVYDPTAFRAD